jgi:hypothetical protein
MAKFAFKPQFMRVFIVVLRYGIIVLFSKHFLAESYLFSALIKRSENIPRHITYTLAKPHAPQYHGLLAELSSQAAIA